MVDVAFAIVAFCLCLSIAALFVICAVPYIELLNEWFSEERND
jgi:hypothetical protein